MIKELEKIIVDILKKEMNLPDNYGKTMDENDIPTIMIRNQNIQLYDAEELQIIVGVVDIKTIANVNRSDFVSCVDTITFSDVPDAGTWTLKYNGDVIGTFTPTNTSQDIEDAFDASYLGRESVSVSGDYDNGFIFSYPKILQPYLLTATGSLTFEGSSVTITVDRTNPPTEIQEVIQRENVQIDIQSKNNEARVRRAQVLMALNSIYSKQQQELYNFKIFEIPTSFVNTGMAEGASVINRWTIVIPCQVWYRNIKDIVSGNYYDQFSTRVDTDESIREPNGIIEFDIP